MKMTKRAVIRSATYIIAGFLVLGVFFYREHKISENYRNQVALNYNHAFSELATAVGEMDTALRKASYASSPSMISSVCAEVYAKAMSAEAALGVLPNGNIELEQTAAFIAKTGDYVYFLTKNSASGNELSKEEKDALSELSKSAARVSETLSDLSAQLIAGSVSIEELERAEHVINEAEESIVGSGLSDGFKQMESEFTEFPTLIYDGPFSAHIKNSKPMLLSGAEEITEEEALEAAKKFAGDASGSFTVENVRDSEVPVYVITRQNGSETMTYEVTKHGGKVLYFGTTRPTGEAVISPEEAIKAADKFLKARGFSSMKTTYWSQDAGQVTINYAYEQDGVLCYPDLIKVSVALDTGSVNAFESLGYIMSHSRREIPAAMVSEDSARKHISDSLTVKSHNLAIIPTSGKNEVFCHEFLCEDTDGRHCLIYVNAETGVEEKILLLLESDTGTLTI